MAENESARMEPSTDEPKEDDAQESTETRGESSLSRLPVNLVSLIVLAVPVYFAAWFWITNPSLFAVFPALGREYSLGGDVFAFDMLAWSIGAVGVYLVVGWFFLETLETYLPKTAAICLAFILGMGMVGFVFELLAMAHWLSRPLVFVFPALLILAFWPFAVWAGRRKPETGEGGEGGTTEQMMRRDMAREAYAKTLIRPETFFAKSFRVLAIALIAIITLLIFYHALLYPEVYWDSLILYLGYARMMFFEGGIVRKVMGQVGIGLGANYPHLYALLGAGTTIAAEQWSELPQRLIAPLSGLASTILVYHSVLRLTRHINFSLAIALLYRSIPLGIFYDQYASDYALAILFAAAFLYVALLYIETGLRGYFIIATLLIALAMHLNYLMGILVLPWGWMIVASHVGLPRPEDEEAERKRRDEAIAEQRPAAIAGWDDGQTQEAPWTMHRARKGLFPFLASPTFAGTVMACLLIGSTWLLRNEIVTENPVYAFFPKVFGGININPEVMASAEKEWSSNGAGIARFGDSLTERIRNSWVYFVGGAAREGDAYRVIWPQSFRLQPFFTGFACIGAILLIARILAVPALYFSKSPGAGRFSDHGLRFGVAALLFAIGLFAFHYILAPFYLYQIILVLPALAILASYSYPYWTRAGFRAAFAVLVLAIGIVPGVAFGLMGGKIFGAIELGPNRWETPQQLAIFRRPLTEPERFYRWRFGEDPLMWRYINRNLRSTRLLTHENRHLVFDPSIELIHLDDWAIQQLWDLTPAKQVESLKRIGISHYLKVPNERAHPINARLGTDLWPKLGLVEEVHRAGENILYRLK